MKQTPANTSTNGDSGSLLNSKTLFLLFGSSLAVKLFLATIGHSVDQIQIRRAVDYLLQGTSPWLYPSDFAYLPPYLYLAAAARVLSFGNETLYNVLVRAPQLAADFMFGWFILQYTLRETRCEKTALWAAALYLFNPLLIYNTAYYGQFDAISLFLVFWAFVAWERRNWSLALLGAAVCVKTFPVFLYAWFARRDRDRIPAAVLIMGLMALGVTAPVLLRTRDVNQFLHAVIFSVEATPRGWSWQTLLYHFFDVGGLVVFSKAALGVYLAALVLAPRKNFVSYTAFAFSLFVLFSKSIYIRYLTWAIPFLILDYAVHKKKHSAFMATAFTLTVFFDNGISRALKSLGFPLTILNISLAACVAGYCLAEIRWALFRTTGEIVR